MKNLWVVPILLAASQATAGGWEASTLDTSFMYQEGNYGEVGNASISYNVKANIQGVDTPKVKMAKNQSRTSLAFKSEYGDLAIGLASYMSGAIQLSGGDATAAGCVPDPTNAAIALCSVVPSADVTMNSLALVGRYKMNDNLSVLAGANRYEIASGATVTSLSGHYAVSGDALVPTFGAAYELSDIALRAELVIQSKTKISNFKAQSSFAAGGAATTLQDVSGESMAIPQTMKLNFQSGIAENTLMFGSIHQANWKDAQIVIPERNNGSALGGVDAVGSSFASRTTYSIGVGRKFTEQFSGLISFTTEAGGGKTTSDPFTLRNGYQSFSIGGRYTVGNITVSGGYNYTLPGDVDLAHESNGAASGLTASYENNNVSALGLKVGFSF
jgi:long-chain fatty acid transport protein